MNLQWMDVTQLTVPLLFDSSTAVEQMTMSAWLGGRLASYILV